MTGAPRDWPSAVPPPGAPEWEAAAVSWLFDLVPPEYRGYDVLRRHPVLLARFTVGHLTASLEAARRGWRELRADLTDRLPAQVVEEAMHAYEREGARLADTLRSVDAVRLALVARSRPDIAAGRTRSGG